MLAPCPGINCNTTRKVPDISGKHLHAHAPGNGTNARVLEPNGMVSCLCHQSAPFHGCGLIKDEDRFTKILQDVAEFALQITSRFALLFQFDSAPDFREDKCANGYFVRVLLKPVQNWPLSSQRITYNVRVR